MADIREIAEELLAGTSDCVELLKQEFCNKIPELDSEVRFRKQQEKFRRMYSNRRK